MIKNESIEKLKSQIDIVDIIEHYVPLKKSGRNFVGICPFHDDKNPSMSVNSDMGIFHCFSCKAGGDAIKFVMDYEKLSYPEAIEKIASFVNFTLEYCDLNVKEKKPDKQILQKLNAYYQSLLFKMPDAINYLHSRGLDDETIMKFGLGYAPSSDNTIRLLQNEGIEFEEAFSVGVLKHNEHGTYASFIDRIIFPINNHIGKLIGFGGRTITNHPAKYVNSPQSAIFDKSSVLYAFDIAKKHAYEKKELIITEGYMDTIMLHKAGFNNVVAVLGTALTEKHIPLIKRGNLRVILSFDGDNAGINAAIKSSRLLTLNEIDTNVVIIENGLDPADMVFNAQIKKLKEIYANGIEAGEFLIRSIVGNFDISRPVQKQKALEEIQKYTFSLKPVVANSYQNLVARILNIKPNSFILSKGYKNESFTQIAKKNTGLNFKKQKDYLELQILKTMAKNKELFNIAIDLCGSEIFKSHKFIFTALLNNEKTQEEVVAIRELVMDESIDEMSSEMELYKGSKILKERFYEDLIETIKRSNDEQKFDKIKKLQNAIKSLRSNK